ncbi:MAG: choice-of-anchor D domain-containing protein [Burkholderiales bacterium]
MDFGTRIRLFLLVAPLAAGGAFAQPIDHALREAALPTRTGPAIAPKFRMLFAPGARWSGAVRWKYNHANAPLPFTNDREGVIAQLARSFDKWSSRCGITYVYDGETTTAPGAGPVDPVMGRQPDGISVVGWGALDPSLGAWTYAWYADNGGVREIFDADVTLSTTNIGSMADLDRLMTHEWGHAFGLDHSDVEAAIMAGPPSTHYNALVDPQPDDVRGCRCSYGLPAGMSAPYACSLPSRIDFGAAAIGMASRAPPVTLTNSGNAPLAIESVNVDSAPFRHASGCPAGTVVMPGASCTIDVEVTPDAVGDASGRLVLFTNDGSYEFALAATGVSGSMASAASAPTVEVVEFYNATLDHYFITWIADEIAKLDAGLTPSKWVRTGGTFRASPSKLPATSAICRFYLPPADGNSHFFGRGTTECGATALAHPDFVLEEPEYMHMLLPNAGSCAAGTRPVYRVFNNREDANHRYTTERAVRDQMVAKGWVAEGDGADLVVMCTPA